MKPKTTPASLPKPPAKVPNWERELAEWLVLAKGLTT